MDPTFLLLLLLSLMISCYNAPAVKLFPATTKLQLDLVLKKVAASLWSVKYDTTGYADYHWDSAALLSGEMTDCSPNQFEVLKPIMENSSGDVTSSPKHLAMRLRTTDQDIYNLGFSIKAKVRCTSVDWNHNTELEVTGKGFYHFQSLFLIVRSLLLYK